MAFKVKAAQQLAALSNPELAKELTEIDVAVRLLAGKTKRPAQRPRSGTLAIKHRTWAVAAARLRGDSTSSMLARQWVAKGLNKAGLRVNQRMHTSKTLQNWDSKEMFDAKLLKGIEALAAAAKEDGLQAKSADVALIIAISLKSTVERTPGAPSAGSSLP